MFPETYETINFNNNGECNCQHETFQGASTDQFVNFGKYVS